MDLDATKGDLVLRGPLPGDRFRPLGLGGSRKVQDILVDARVPRMDRWRVPLLVDGVGVIWVVGHRMDERVGLRATTRHILKAVVCSLEKDSQYGKPAIPPRPQA
jgi:tRNA(Ile)-lysidine synthase